MSKITGVFPSLPVATTEQSLVSRAGLTVVTSFVGALGFRGLCEDRLGQFVPFGAWHRPGTILGSLAVMLAGGGEHVSDLDILRTGAGVFGKIASNATISRFFERTVTNPEVFTLDADGHRITAFLTNSPRWHGPTLDARHRARGRCENRIKTLKNTGLGKLPFFDFPANQAWANIAALAMNLVAWLQLTALPTGHKARGWDIKRWRYRLFATAGKIQQNQPERELAPDPTPNPAIMKNPG